MNKPVFIQPPGFLARLGDVLLTPFMYLFSGTFKETPQRTHVWNSIRFSDQEVSHFDTEQMVQCGGISGAIRQVNQIPIFHLPVLGGWRDYVVLEPVNYKSTWNIGWNISGTTGASRFVLQGPVRILVGPKAICFFGINTQTGEQIPIRKIAVGRIGKGGEYAQIPLL